jgi:DNA-binding NarL/FixJ family response regulator
MALTLPRTLILAADPLARAGLASLLTATGTTVVGQVAPPEDLGEIIAIYQPDVLLWDLGWNPDRSLEQLADFTQPEDSAGLPAILVLLAHEEQAAAVWQAGVRGLLLRSASQEQIAAALHAVAEGLAVLDPTLPTLLMHLRPESLEPAAEPLTPREMEVLQLLAQGMPNKTIARSLHISEHTVKFHVNSILGKLGAQSRTDAVVRASRAGLVLL